MRTALLALALLILPAVAATQVTDTDGWNGAKWGMTVAQVKSSITYRIERDSQFRYAGKPSSLFRTAEPFKMLDAPFWGSFLFSPDDKLVSVELRIDVHFFDSTHSQSELFGRFKQWLVEKYWKPAFTDDNGRTAVWTFPLTSIRLQWTEFGGHTFMAVTYNQADKKLPGWLDRRQLSFRHWA